MNIMMLTRYKDKIQPRQALHNVTFVNYDPFEQNHPMKFSPMDITGKRGYKGEMRNDMMVLDAEDIAITDLQQPPVHSGHMLDMLRAEEVLCAYYEHVPVHSVADARQVRAGMLATDEGGGHIKNLFLRDKRNKNIGQNYLVVLHEEAEIGLDKIAEKIGAKRLSFGSPERLMTCLGVRPGAVTPLAMVTGIKHDVKLYMDKDLQNARLLYMHPLVNDKTVAMQVTDFERFLTARDVPINYVQF